tara:strand:+ start:1730 stop:1903 length:174 start_codon:yes stop_codon:yes gene_type:complete
MGASVDQRNDEKLASEFIGPYANGDAWKSLEEQAENLAQQDGMPFKKALELVSRQPR